MLHRVLLLFVSLCRAEPLGLRLVGGASRCRGQLQIQRTGLDWTGVNWGTVTMQFGNRVCAALDCGSVLFLSSKKGTEVVLASPDACEETPLSSCFGFSRFGGAGTLYSVELHCSDSVRLVSGRSLCSGSLQVWNQSWSPVCEGALDHQGAEVLCRELGWQGDPALQGALSPLEQMFHCEGNESTLMDCPRTWTDQANCSGPPLQITCSGLRLEGRASRCGGTVGVSVGGEWRRVWTSPELWDLEAATTVCRDLDCGSAVSVETRDGLPLSPVWFVSADCMKKKAVRACVRSVATRAQVGLEVLCSGLLHRPVLSVSVREGLSEARPLGVRLQLGSHFSLECSVEPQYQGGSFQLLSPTLNHTLPADNHSAHFPFPEAGLAHRGDYTCVYHLHVFSHNFSSNSSLRITVGVSDSQFLVRALILLLLQLVYIVPNLYCYCQAARGRRRSPRRASP